MPIIMHVDLDAFYASVEEREHPEYKGKPLVVGADPKGGTGRGVVSTCNYAARKYGIRSAMPISIAYRKCPEAIFVPVNMKLYVETSQRIMEILRKHADKFEQVSVDEAYLDVTRLETYEKARGLATGIKKEILTKEKLTCSIGIGLNKLISKVASDYNKPDNLTIVPPNRVWDFLGPQNVRVLRGVGPKTEEALNKMNVKTVNALRQLSKEELISKFGRFGESLYEQARGNYETELVEGWTAKSIGRNHTFEQDTKNKEEIFAVLQEMTNDVWKQLKSDGLRYKTITVRIRYDDFGTHTKQKSLIDRTDSIDALKAISKEITEKFLQDPRKIRLIGISVSQLS